MNYNIKKEYYDEYIALAMQFAKFSEKQAIFEKAFGQLVENYKFKDAYSPMHLYEKLQEYFELDGHLYLFEMHFNQTFDSFESELDEYEIHLKKAIHKHQNLAMLAILEKIYNIKENQYWILSRTNVDDLKEKSICFKYEMNIITIKLPKLEG